MDIAITNERNDADKRSHRGFRGHVKQESALNPKDIDELIHQERMSAVGAMVAGVAHELNNPMMGILNYVQYCIKKTSQQPKINFVLQDAEREVLRCIEIVDSLVKFSRKDSADHQDFVEESIGNVLRRVLRLLGYRWWKEKVFIRFHVDKDVPKLYMRVNSIVQVLLNLVTNSIDALESTTKKAITIAAKKVEGRVVISIKDTGEGIAEENLRKIFEPFFTTKAPGKGTGLGLALCDAIIKNHNGELTCESTVGVGTIFIISLPLHSKKEDYGCASKKSAGN